MSGMGGSSMGSLTVQSTGASGSTMSGMSGGSPMGGGSMGSELKYENTMNQLQAEYIRITQQLEDAARKIDLYQKQYDLSLVTYQLIVREFPTGSTTLTDVIQVE